LGNGLGIAVQEVIDAARRVSGRDFEDTKEGRREGDPARLLADCQKAKQALGWSPQYADLDTIIRHAWDWKLSMYKTKLG
jgi:UDP-glucose 4-epimerase